MSFCLKNQINGLGLLGQTIKNIKEENLNNETKSLEEYTKYRKEEESNFLGKFEKIEEKNNKLKEFLETHYYQSKSENDTRLVILEQRINTIEKAVSILKTDYIEIVNNFKKNIEETHKNPEIINKMIQDWRLIETYQHYYERNTEVINELMLTKLHIDKM